MEQKLTLRAIKWCAEEVQRQQDDAIAVFNMCKAYDYLQTYTEGGIFYPNPNAELLLELGKLVKPNLNGGFRTLPIKIKGKVIHPHDDFGRQLDILAEAYEDGVIKADEWYYRFEDLHPFLDGNGRVGALIWNAMNEWTMKVPPRFNDLEVEYGPGQ